MNARAKAISPPLARERSPEEHKQILADLQVRHGSGLKLFVGDMPVTPRRKRAAAVRPQLKLYVEES